MAEPKSKLDLFLEKISVDEKTGCWIWTATAGPKGPRFHFDGQWRPAKRFAYAAYVGDIPKNTYVIRKCDNALCVNPDHHAAVSRSGHVKSLMSENGSFGFIRERQYVLTKEHLQDVIQQMSIPEPNTGCWLWDGSFRSVGYGVMFLNGKHVAAHRASYSAFKEDPPEGLFVCHRCDVTACVNPDHLFLGTHLDNMEDAKKKGRFRSGPTGKPGMTGEQHPQAKLTTEQVVSIQRALATKEPISHIARRHNISRPNIYLIKDGKAWAHLQNTESTNG